MHSDDTDHGAGPPSDDPMAGAPLDDPSEGQGRSDAQRADPDAPGNYVDDEESAEIPEPNEPG